MTLPRFLWWVEVRNRGFGACREVHDDTATDCQAFFGLASPGALVVAEGAVAGLGDVVASEMFVSARLQTAGA